MNTNPATMNNNILAASKNLPSLYHSLFTRDPTNSLFSSAVRQPT